MKRLVLDIESRPHLVHRWGLYDSSPVALNQVQEFGGVFAFAAKWYEDPKVQFFSDFHDGHEIMVQAAHSLIDEADVVIGYNHSSFDMPYLNTEMWLLNLKPPAPVQEVDLCRIIKKRFRFASNKLDHVATMLGLGGKVKHSGHDLWVRCLEGDARAWDQMRQYNIGDVRLTERVYEYALPWIANHPNHGLFVESDEQVCPNCGQEGQLQKRGFKATQLSTFQQYQCQACGAWSRGKTAIARVDERGTA